MLGLLDFIIVDRLAVEEEEAARSLVVVELELRCEEERRYRGEVRMLVSREGGRCIFGDWGGPIVEMRGWGMGM